jgi:hypothetical protein
LSGEQGAAETHSAVDGAIATKNAIGGDAGRIPSCRGRNKTRQRWFKTRQRRRSKTGFLRDIARSDWS